MNCRTVTPALQKNPQVQLIRRPHTQLLHLSFFWYDRLHKETLEVTPIGPISAYMQPHEELSPDCFTEALPQ